MNSIFPVDKDEYRIGVISDTHGLLRPEAYNELYGSDLIIHAGDIGDPSIIRRLSEIAPVRAVRGNVDVTPQLFIYPATDVIDAGSARIYVIHNINDLEIKPAAEKINVVIYGHSHKAAEETRNGILFFNPGSAGKRRFSYPVTVGELKITKKKISSRIITIIF